MKFLLVAQNFFQKTRNWNLCHILNIAPNSMYHLANESFVKMFCLIDSLQEQSFFNISSFFKLSTTTHPVEKALFLQRFHQIKNRLDVICWGKVSSFHLWCLALILINFSKTFTSFNFFVFWSKKVWGNKSFYRIWMKKYFTISNNFVPFGF